MPVYEYKCDSCDEFYEFTQKFTDDPISECPKCEGPIKKIYRSPGLVFKGSGWHIKDYGK